MDKELHETFIHQLDTLIYETCKKIETNNIAPENYKTTIKQFNEYLDEIKILKEYQCFSGYLDRIPIPPFKHWNNIDVLISLILGEYTDYFSTEYREEKVKQYLINMVNFFQGLKDLLEEIEL
jgi:hypothetical protein